MVLTLAISEGEYSIHRFESTFPIPEEVLESDCYFVGKTDEEMSIVCNFSIDLDSPKTVHGWAYIKVIGPLDFNLPGILSGISEILAQAGISICAMSTFDTDYIFVRTGDLDKARSALEKAGYEFE